MRISDFERDLSEQLARVPRLVLAELVGPWVTEGQNEPGTIDLLVVVDSGDGDALSMWRVEHLEPILEDLERQLGRGFEVIALTRGDFEYSAHRGSALLAGIYSCPRVPLISSLDEQLSSEVAAGLAGNALSLSEQVGDAGLRRGSLV
jgi:hypothetical protein